MFAPEAARSSRALFAAANPATLGPEQLAGEYSAGLWRTGQADRICFRRALRASAHDNGTACVHARPDPSLGCGHSMKDKSKPQSTQAEWLNVLSEAIAARRGLFFLPRPNTRSLCLLLCGCNQGVRHLRIADRLP